MSNSVENNSAHYSTVFKQTLKFSKDIPEQKISPEGFLIRDCGCVMRFLPSLDKLSKYQYLANKKNLQLFIQIKMFCLFH